MSGPSGMGKPAFMPASVRNQQVQQVGLVQGLKDHASINGVFQNHKEDLHYKRTQASSAIPVSPAAVISKPATWQDDEDVFSTLLKYEKEVGFNYLWVNLIKFFLRCELRRRRRSILRSRRRQWAWEEEPAWSNLRNPPSR